DESRCPLTTSDGRHLTDEELARFNDAADEVVNGDSDIDNLAKIHVSIPPDAGAAAVTPDAGSRDRVRLFVASGDGATAGDWTALAEDGAVGVEDRSDRPIVLGIEAKDVVRDSSWSGLCTLSLAVELADGVRVTDSVALRVAPLLFVSEVCPIETLYAADNA